MHKYETEQRKRLMDFLKKHLDKQLSIDFIENKLAGISKSSIYRNINQMVDVGVIRRFQKEGSRKFLYQYIGSIQCKEHLHLKCSECGAIYHMDKSLSKKLMRIVIENTKFDLDMSKTMLFGLCSNCK